jgi:hypothetical protein
MQADEDGDIKGRITDSYALISTVVVVLVAFGFGFGFGCTVRMHQERDPLYGASEFHYLVYMIHFTSLFVL